MRASDFSPRRTAASNSAWTLPNQVGWPVAKELLFSGHVVEAEEAHRIGLLNHLVPCADLRAKTLWLGAMIAGNRRESVMGVKALLLQHMGGTLRRAMAERARVHDQGRPRRAGRGRLPRVHRPEGPAGRLTMLDIPFRSARQLAAGVRKKEIGCLELLDLYLTRIERYDGAINAVVVRDFDRARRRARAADRALAKGDLWRQLHGVPITVKESYDVAGLPTTWGLPGPQGPRRGEERARSGPAGRRRRRAVRQDQCAAVPRGLAELQCHLWDHQ